RPGQHLCEIGRPGPGKTQGLYYLVDKIMEAGREQILWFDIGKGDEILTLPHYSRQQPASPRPAAQSPSNTATRSTHSAGPTTSRIGPSAAWPMSGRTSSPGESMSVVLTRLYWTRASFSSR